jgi:hypothetical protein
MPNWQPNWQNVRWDYDAADQAVAALRRAAEELERTADERQRAAQRATTEWRGTHRATFDAYLREALNRARALATEYRDAARRIALASQRAHEEQRRRVAQRERWQQEKAAEERKPHP